MCGEQRRDAGSLARATSALSAYSAVRVFPVQIPTFFRFLTDPDDLVLDPFAGSYTTGEACEREERRWIVVETEGRYVEASRFRFTGDLQALPDLYESVLRGQCELEFDLIDSRLQLGSLGGGQRSGGCRKPKPAYDMIPQGDQLRVTDIRNLL